MVSGKCPLMVQQIIDQTMDQTIMSFSVMREKCTTYPWEQSVAVNHAATCFDVRLIRGLICAFCVPVQCAVSISSTSLKTQTLS